MKKKNTKLIKVECPHCGNVGATKYGNKDGQRYKCASCNGTFRISQIPKNQRVAIPVLLHLLRGAPTPIIKDIETNKRFNKAAKSLVETSADYKLVEGEITKDNAKDLRTRGNGLTLLYTDAQSKQIKAIKLDGKYNISCNVTYDGNIELTLQK